MSYHNEHSTSKGKQFNDVTAGVSFTQITLNQNSITIRNVGAKKKEHERIKHPNITLARRLCVW